MNETEPVSKTRLRLWLKLLKASNRIEDEIRRKLREDYQSTLPRFDVMSALFRYPDGLKMSEISDLLRVSNGNITGIVDRLTQEGLAERASVPGDRRASLVRLTDTGRSAFAEHAAAHEGWIDRLLTGLSEEDTAAMIARLDKLIDTLEDPRP